MPPLVGTVAESREAPVTSLEVTYTGVLIAVFANQLCLPIPSIFFLMAAGALSAHGAMRAGLIVFLGVAGCLTADGLWFWFGSRWGSQAMRLLCRFATDPRGCASNARTKFRRYGLPLLFVYKFVPGLDGLLPPLCGAEGVSPARFIALDTAGSFLWAGCYVGVGYVFSDQLDAALRWAEHFGTALVIEMGVPLLLYAGWRGLVLVRMIRHLRVRRITPPMLARKLKSRMKVAVLDLLSFEHDTEGPGVMAIPGAFWVDPARLRTSPQITVPDDVELILYCSAQRDVVSARVAVALKRIGLDRVWVLEGGLKAWREQGFPVAQLLEPPEVVAERLGVTLPEPGR
jgi:membrane protein DedA with SNARE-associated domain/rhodanese-related sulfurtransferase